MAQAAHDILTRVTVFEKVDLVNYSPPIAIGGNS